MTYFEMESVMCISCELYACDSCEELHALGACCCGRIVDEHHDDDDEWVTDEQWLEEHRHAIAVRGLTGEPARLSINGREYRRRLKGRRRS